MLKKLDFLYKKTYYYKVADIKKFVQTNKILTTYSLILILTFIFLWVVNFFNISYPLTITSMQTSGELAVVGVGKVDIIPDTASVDLGIVVSDVKTVDEAQTKMNTVNNAIVESVKKVGIDEKDVKTSNYSITPTYNYDRGANSITGYSGNATVTIKVRDTSKLPAVIQEATKAGANQVMGTNYLVDKPETYREKARQMAINNAKEQAQKLASQLGIRLGRVTNIVESSNGTGPIPMMYAEKSIGMGGQAPAPDLQPGTQTITSTVTLYFEKR